MVITILVGDDDNDGAGERERERERDDNDDNDIDNLDNNYNTISKNTSRVSLSSDLSFGVEHIQLFPQSGSFHWCR